MFATSAVLAAAIGKLEADIVLFGMASTDGGGGVMAAWSRTGWVCQR